MVVPIPRAMLVSMRNEELLMQAFAFLRQMPHSGFAPDVCIIVDESHFPEQFKELFSALCEEANERLAEVHPHLPKFHKNNNFKLYLRRYRQTQDKAVVCDARDCHGTFAMMYSDKPGLQIRGDEWEDVTTYETTPTLLFGKAMQRLVPGAPCATTHRVVCAGVMHEIMLCVKPDADL